MKYGLLLASHIIEEWRQYYISYDALKKEIDILKSQVYGIDDASTSSAGTPHTKCAILIKILLYCFACCLKSRDADVIAVAEDTMQKPYGLRIGVNNNNQQQPLTPNSMSSIDSRSHSMHKHYATLKQPFTLVKTARDVMTSQMLGSISPSKTKLGSPSKKGGNKHIEINEKDEVFQPLMQNAYSPPVASYSPISDEEEKKEDIITGTDQIEESKHDDMDDMDDIDDNVQGYIFKNRTDKKSLAIQRWKEKIYEESDKVNKFYLNIENQLLSEYEQIEHKLDKLYKLLQNKYKQNKGHESHSILTDLDTDNEESPHSRSQVVPPLNNVGILRSRSPIRDIQNKSLRLLEPLKIPKKYQKRNIHLYQMKLNIFILYQRFIALNNFRTLNQIGFRKILKKFDKNIKAFEQKKLMKEINSMDFIESAQCTECMNELIKAYGNMFEGGDFHKAKVKLLESISWSKWSSSSSFKVGLKIGVLIGLIGWTVTALYTVKKDTLPTNAVYSYRAIGCFLAFLWFWSGDIYIWSKYRINYVFIFEFEPRTRLTFLQYFDEAATLSLIYFINCILFIKSVDWMEKKYIIIWPTSLLIFFILRLFLPIFDYWKSRQVIIDALMQTIIAPFGRVRFRDFFMGDVLTSLVKVIADLYLAICVLSLDEYYTTESSSFCLSSELSKIIKPICICAPYWFRFCQCLNRYFNTHDRIPHLPNAVKYGTAMSVTLLGTLHGNFSKIDTNSNIWSPGRVIWLVATIISTCYLIFWDLAMDWRLFKIDRIKEYPKYWYIVALFFDICLRYLWTFTLFPTTANPYFHEHFTYLNAAYFLAFIEIAELFRRSLWAIFRVENAHVSRKDEFRSYEYVPLFYEHTSLIEQQRKSNKPTSMILETVAIFVVVLIITVVIVLTS